MEKFSQFRDPGTGIQPFLTPIPPAAGSDVVTYLLLPFGILLGVVRITLVAAVTLLYVLLVDGVCLILRPIPPIHRLITGLFTSFLTRLVLLLVGIPWIPVEVVPRKRGKGNAWAEKWNPKAGDVIVSNWVSWIEILWIAFRFNPIFAVPVFAKIEPAATARSSAPITSTPGRRTGTGSAAVSTPSTRAPTPRAQVLGWKTASLLEMINNTGRIPAMTSEKEGDRLQSFEEIRSQADRPIVVFPEGSTSNGRGIMRFADVFKGVTVPVMKYKVFVMCVRYDPPTTVAPSLSHSLPSATLNPISHLFKLTSSFVPFTLSIRLLPPSESPSSGSFLLSELITDSTLADPLSEVCASIISQIGKVKRVGMGWEDKAAFLEFYRGKRK